MSSAVITGLGAVLPAGLGREDLAKALAGGEPRWSEVERHPKAHRCDSARLGGLTTGLDLSPWLSPRLARRMSPPSKLAVAATLMALEDAALQDAALEDATLQTQPEDLTAVVAANAFGPSSFVERFFLQTLDEGPTAASPALFPETVANAPAAHVAMLCHATGANVTVTQREASGLLALQRGAAEVISGRSRTALVLAVDELTPLLHALLDRFHALARPDGDGVEMARPFDRRRNGFIFAEGATALVVESENVARRRGAPILARVHSSAAAFDPGAPRISWGRDPEILAAALSRYLDRFEVPLESFDLIVSGASGARRGDALEAQVLRRVWGERPLPPILAPKAALGEHTGVVTTAALLALQGRAFGPTPGFAEPDPELQIAPLDGRELGQVRRVLLTSLASGGAAAWMILEGVET